MQPLPTRANHTRRPPCIGCREPRDLSDRARCLVLVVQGCLVSMKALRHDEWVPSAARVMVADLRA